MQTPTETLDQQIVSRYTGQPSRLPAELRRRIESAWGGPVLLYALADLGPDLSLTEIWCALGATRMAVARRDPVGGEWDVDDFPRRRITAVRERPGLSATTLTLAAAPDEPAVAVLRYSNRQRRAFENLRFVLEEGLAGRSVDTPDPDGGYAESVAHPVRDAQACASLRERFRTTRPM